jgi:hypothetical protein
MSTKGRSFLDPLSYSLEERRFTLDHQGIEPRVPNRGRFLLILKLNYVKNEYELDKNKIRNRTRNIRLEHGLTTKSPCRRILSGELLG